MIHAIYALPRRLRCDDPAVVLVEALAAAEKAVEDNK